MTMIKAATPNVTPKSEMMVTIETARSCFLGFRKRQATMRSKVENGLLRPSFLIELSFDFADLLTAASVKISSLTLSC